MLLSSLILRLLPVISAVAAAPQRCLPSGNEKAINEALQRGGKGAVIELCQGSVHRLNSTVLFTASRQTLTTEGNPTARGRALLIVEGQNQAIAIQADCRECAYAKIASLEVDGNRAQLLRVPGGGALLELGNAEGQVVRYCRLYEPRGWSALHFREGDRKQCTRGAILDNEIGPCGEEWDDEYDGVVETAALLWGNPRSDGISLACQYSRVERNIVYDATDGAIVLFGSGGTEVHHNEVFARTRIVLGGINLVDYDPWAGDYFGVKVYKNKIHALGRYLKVGIVIGASSWSDDTDSIVRSGTVTDNTFYGQHFGYGIVVSSVKDFTVLRNVADDGAQFSGVKGPRCPRAPENGRPKAFLINRGSAEGTFQNDFVNGEVQHSTFQTLAIAQFQAPRIILTRPSFSYPGYPSGRTQELTKAVICIDPAPDANGVPYRPWRFRDSPLAIEAKAAENGEANGAASMDNGAVDARLAEALVSYQMTLISSMDRVNHQIEKVGQPADDSEPSPRGPTGHPEVDSMANQLSSLESGEKKLHATFENLQVEFDGLAHRMKRTMEEHGPILQGLFKSVAGLKASPAVPAGAYRDHPSRGDEEDASLGSASLGPLGMFAGSGLLVWVALSFVRRWRSRRASTTKKGNKIF